MRRYLFYAFIILLSWASTGFSEENVRVRVGFLENAPLSFVGSDGVGRGLSIDLLNAISQKANWEISFVYTSQDESLGMLKRGEVDLLASFPFEYDLLDDFSFTSNSIVADWGALYSAGDSYSTLQELDGLRVGVTDDVHAEKFKSLIGSLGLGITLLEFRTYREALEAVRDGKVDAGVANRLFGLRFGSEIGVEATPILFNPVSIRFVASNSNTNDYLTIADEQLGEFKADNESVYYSSLKKWMSPTHAGRWLVKSDYLWGGAVLLFLLVSVSLWLWRQLFTTSTEVSRQGEALKEETEVRKRAQVALWESVERHRAMFTDNKLPQLLMKAGDGNIVEVNPAAEKYYGCTADDFAGMTAVDFSAESVVKAKSIMVEIEHGKSHVLTKHIVANGEIRDVELFVSALYLQSERHDLVTVVDITERVLAEKARAESEDRLGRINDCVLGFGPDAERNIGSLVDLTGKLLGGCASFYSRSEHSFKKRGNAWSDSEYTNVVGVSPGHISFDLIQRNVEGMYLIENLENTPYYENDPDVKPLKAKSYVGQIIRMGGVPVGALCVFFDFDYRLTQSDQKVFGIIVSALQVEEERKRSREELVAARDAAEFASRSKSEFLANMSHEIRTPLNGMFGMLQLVADTNLNDEQLDYVDTALTSGRSLLRVINDVLDFSKMEAGMLTIENEPFDFRQVAHEVLENFTVQAAEKGLKMSVDVAEDTPPVLMGDAARIRQILFNLIGNSVKFTPSGSVSVESCVFPSQTPEGSMRLFVTVSDTGIGIKDDVVEEIFDAFSQGDGSHTRQYGGTGLGLGIVKRLVNLMNGELAVENNEDGTLIHFFVNVDSAMAAPEIDDIPISPSINLEPLNILLAEDERINRLSVLRHLEKLGHTVSTASDGQEAIDKLRWNEYDIILMDIQMPGMDGLTATRTIRGDESLGDKRNTPIIALTAHAMKGDRDKFLAAGMNDYVAKPVEFSDLVSVLVRLAGVR